MVFNKTDANGNPAPEDVNGSNITSGPYKGLKGIITKYPITITARSTTGKAEVRLRRELQTVAVPVFQFGVFSDGDLSFFAGPDFNFGGRVHTNGTLYLAEGDGNTLTLSDRVTSAGEVIRWRLSNGFLTSANYTGAVSVTKAQGGPFRDLARTEGSLVNGPGTATNEPTWTSLSVGTYKSYIRSSRTGGKRLDLPVATQGATAIDLIRRPLVNEDVNNNAVYVQRQFSLASLRILLSDVAADITNLPSVTNVAPIALDSWLAGEPAGYGPVDATHPPMTRSPGPMAATTTLNGAVTSAGGNPLATATDLIVPVNVGIPVDLKFPLLSVGALADVVCTGKTANTFTGCVIGTNQPANSVVSAVITYGTHTYTASTTLTVASGTGGNVTITVPANGTLPFARRMFWVNGTAVAPTPPATAVVSCTGYTDAGAVHQFTGCGYEGNAVPANGQTISTNAAVPLDTGLIGGFIKIEKQSAAGAWTDVTMEILNLGMSGQNQDGTICADPTPDAVIRIQRLRDNGKGACDYAGSTNPYDHWPNVLYDPREGNDRDVAINGAGSAMNLGGVMSYIALDAANLKKWLAGTTGTTGTVAVSNNGYIVYFSDRRGDHNENVADAETGAYGSEDIVNPASAAGTPSTTLDVGEDVNNNLVLDVYGETPTACCGVVPAGTTSPSPYDANARPWTQFTAASSGNPGMARVNKQVLFRRALKLVNGGINAGVNNLPTAGLTVASENPVYVQGNYNATSASANAAPNVAAAIIADGVTLLSNQWLDSTSFLAPNDPALRPVTTSASYRMAVAAGKTLSFPRPAWAAAQDFGTDGGVHNFLRYIEGWNGQTLNYRGSIVSLFTSRQAIGAYKCCTNVYSPPTRAYAFDTNFLLPALLPPGTPMFRDVNTLTFRQILRPTQ